MKRKEPSREEVYYNHYYLWISLGCKYHFNMYYEEYWYLPEEVKLSLRIKAEEENDKWEAAIAAEIAEKEARIIYFTRPDGSKTRMRSQSEVKFAKYLDKKGIEFEYEARTFDTPMGKYTPDFYIGKWNLYIEVKGSYWMKKAPIQQEKRKYLRNQGISIALLDSNAIDKEMK